MAWMFARGFGLVLFLLVAKGACAGVYAGYDSNGEGGRIGFLGFQTAGPFVLDIFLADLTYRYLDGDVTVSARSRMVVPTVGYRWGDTWSTTLLVGPSFVDKEEDTGARTDRSAETGGTARLGVYSAQFPYTTEALASYSTYDRFIWTRARVTRSVTPRFAPGGEVFWMDGRDANSYGAGVVLGIRAGFGSLALRSGYQRATNGEDTIYGGLDAAVFF